MSDDNKTPKDITSVVGDDKSEGFMATGTAPTSSLMFDVENVPEGAIKNDVEEDKTLSELESDEMILDDDFDQLMNELGGDAEAESYDKPKPSIKEDPKPKEEAVSGPELKNGGGGKDNGNGNDDEGGEGGEDDDDDDDESEDSLKERIIYFLKEKWLAIIAATILIGFVGFMLFSIVKNLLNSSPQPVAQVQSSSYLENIKADSGFSIDDNGISTRNSSIKPVEAKPVKTEPVEVRPVEVRPVEVEPVEVISITPRKVTPAGSKSGSPETVNELREMALTPNSQLFEVTPTNPNDIRVDSVLENQNLSLKRELEILKSGMNDRPKNVDRSDNPASERNYELIVEMAKGQRQYKEDITREISEIKDLLKRALTNQKLLKKAALENASNIEKQRQSIEIVGQAVVKNRKEIGTKIIQGNSNRTPERAPSPVKKARPKIAYRIISASPGRAWLISKKTGKPVSLVVGENLIGYGRVTAINQFGTIQTVAGKVKTR
jgi:hypothetical protein